VAPFNALVLGLSSARLQEATAAMPPLRVAVRVLIAALIAVLVAYIAVEQIGSWRRRRSGRG
jgi:hypothetical protein